MATTDIASEKFLVFLFSTASSAIGLLLLSVFLNKFIVLGNMQFSGAMAAVLLSLISNGLIFSVNKTISTISVKEKLTTQLIVCFLVILVTVVIFSMFVQITGLKLLNILGGVAIAFVITAIQFFTSKYAFKILSKDY